MKSIHQMLGRRRREQRGAAIVEFALIMPILFVLLFGIIQYGMYFYSMQSGTSAVGDAARRMSVGDCQSAGAARTFVYNKLGAATTAQSASSLTAAATYTQADGVTSAAAPGEIGGTVTLTVTFPSYDFGFFLLPVPDNVTRTASARIEDITAMAGGC